MGTTTLTFTGDSSSATEAIAKLERKYAEMENKIKGIGKATRAPQSATDDWGSSLDAVVNKLGLAGAAMGAMHSVASGITGEIQNWVNKLNEAGEKNAKPQVKLEIQAGMKAGEFDKLMPEIEKQLSETPVTDLVGAVTTQTQLASSGFNKKDVDSGAALGATLRLQAATASFGEEVDPKQAAKVTSQTLRGAGIDPSAKNMEEVSKKFTSVFKESDVQFNDFEQLAPKLAGLKNFGMNLNESLGAFSAGAEVLGGNMADSGIANFVDRMGTAGAHPERVEALKQVGLTPNYTAFGANGKSFFQNVDYMKSKFEAADPKTRNEVLSKVLGQDAMPMANVLFSDNGNKRAKELTQVASDPTAYDEGVKTFQESRYADQNRTKVKTDLEAWKADKKSGGYTWQEQENDAQLKHMKDVNSAEGIGGRLDAHYESWRSGTLNWAAKTAGLTPQDVGYTRKDARQVAAVPVLNGPKAPAGDLKPGNMEFAEPGAAVNPSDMKEVKEALKEVANALKANTKATESNTKSDEKSEKADDELARRGDKRATERVRKRKVNPKGNVE